MRKPRCQRFVTNDVMRYTKSNRSRIHRMVLELRYEGLTYSEIKNFCIERNIKNSKGDTPSRSSIRAWSISAREEFGRAFDVSYKKTFPILLLSSVKSYPNPNFYIDTIEWLQYKFDQDTNRRFEVIGNTSIDSTWRKVSKGLGAYHNSSYLMRHTRFGVGAGEMLRSLMVMIGSLRLGGSGVAVAEEYRIPQFKWSKKKKKEVSIPTSALPVRIKFSSLEVLNYKTEIYKYITYDEARRLI